MLGNPRGSYERRVLRVNAGAVAPVSSGDRCERHRGCIAGAVNRHSVAATLGLSWYLFSMDKKFIPLKNKDRAHVGLSGSFVYGLSLVGHLQRNWPR